MKALKLVLLAFFCCAVYADDSESEENVAEITKITTNIKALHIETPKYPHRALHRGIEGWVIVGFSVEADGTTGNIEVLESSIDDYFDDAAIEATRLRTYEPAKLADKPVMQGNVTAKYSFLFTSSDGGVGRQFQKAYKKAAGAIEEGDLELAKRLIDQLDAEERRVLAEVCYLDMLKASYFDKTGDDKDTLRYVERALRIADVVASKAIYINLLRQSIVDNAKANNLHTSLERYNTLLEVDKQLDLNDPMHEFARRVERILDGDANIPTMGEITRSCRSCETPGEYFWQHILNRKRFLIDQVTGQLTEVAIICETSTVTVAYQSDTAWTVNKDGGDCSIRVIGDKDTKFRLIELANSNWSKLQD